MLDVEVVPELALRSSSWELVLGMPLQQAIETIRRQDNIPSVDFWYNDKFPFSSDFMLNLLNDGLKLYFDSKLQRLTMIEIYDLQKIILRYWSQCFNYPTSTPKIQDIIRIFGSTKQLLPEEDRDEYRLCYRGITFILSSQSPRKDDAAMSVASPIPSLQGIFSPSSSGTATPTSADALLLSAPNSSLLVTRIFIFLGPSIADAKLPLQLPSSCYHGNIFLDRLRVVRDGEFTRELSLDLISQELPINPAREPKILRFTASVKFGDSVQEVLSALGSPSRIFYKTEDKMKIHLPQPYRHVRQRRSDFFYNYFTLGLDLLFDARSQRVISFVLHTNHPGEYTFNTYYRCMFEIPLNVSAAGQDVSLIVTPFVKWSDIRGVLGDAVDSEPVVIHRETKPRKNPFGATHAYGYCDTIFEVIPQCGYLGSVTIYSLPNGR